MINRIKFIIKVLLVILLSVCLIDTIIMELRLMPFAESFSTSLAGFTLYLYSSIGCISFFIFLFRKLFKNS